MQSSDQLDYITYTVSNKIIFYTLSNSGWEAQDMEATIDVAAKISKHQLYHD